MKTLITGNEAVAKAALKSGLKFYSGYPITPASEIMHSLSKEKSIKFVHTEDEIAAIIMALGASLAGAKTMTATSGPGFSLMQEGIGLAYAAQIPIVIVDCQRVGPSTGMPTLASQGDVLQSAYGTHGDTFPIVLAPNSVKECYEITAKAFNAAEESMGPVMLLMDAFLSRLYESVDLDKIKVEVTQRKLKPLGTSKRHFTGLLSKDNIPCTTDSEYYREWLNRMKEKRDKAAANYELYEYIENNDSDTLLIAYGMTSRVILPLKDKYSIFRPIRLFPVIEKLKDIARKYKKIIVVEMNNGQYSKEVERILKREIEVLPQLGGKLSLKEIRQKIK
ncbi:MAG: thiamine pyrophosphate-binding protein [Candidatus Woesearchaeota archaeon]